MFCVGDKIVYPMYGAGIIEDLEHKSIDGGLTNNVYYVLNIPVGNLKIMLSANKAVGLGVREISHEDEVVDIIESIMSEPIDMPENWNERYKLNMEKIKTGRLSEAALVFRNLMIREQKRVLSSAEKKVLTSAKQVILSELILSLNIEKSEAEAILMRTLEKSVFAVN
ncbi:MAG: CarD family transcriptional regulator [Defluviitaleaceae bacterium]|nr:CarD family transcriptional regulator [Defluviitaleaceae bacterium]